MDESESSKLVIGISFDIKINEEAFRACLCIFVEELIGQLLEDLSYKLMYDPSMSPFKIDTMERILELAERLTSDIVAFAGAAAFVALKFSSD